MKQFKCSMSKKKKSLGKKQESISGKDLMDPEQFEKDIREMIDGEKEDILKDVDDDERMYYEMAFETLGDSDYDYAGELCKRLQDDMLKYVSGNDYRIMGNFNNIEWDWENAHEDGIKFRDLRKKLLDGVNDADTDEFSTWAIDWFFDTFGTYNMCYKYRDTISDLAYSYQREDEEERERENSDESKKNEKGTTKIETYDGFDELLGYADAEYLLEDVVDVLSKYYTYEDETFDEDQAKDDPEFTIKIEGGDERADFYSEDIFYVHLPNKEAAEELAKVLGGELNESKKPESRKDGKKESMERCDSCGAVMTEYDYDRYGGLCKHCRDKGAAKKSEDASSVDDLLARHNQKWLVKVSYDVDASHSAVAPSIVRADTKDAATNIALKRHRGLGDNMKVVSVEPMTESRKKSEGISDMIDAKIDYNMFMRMCKTAAYLEEDEDYWDALWDFYSEVGNIGDALEFFDNLFQYTAWKDVDETYDELDESDQDGSKSKEECIKAVLDRDGEIRGSLVQNYGDYYLWVY